MHVCAQQTEIEEGFYYGTGYVSYAMAVAFSVSTFVAWWILIGMSVNDNRVFWWLGINAFLMLILQPYLMRLSRTIWLSIFVKYDATWRSGKNKTGCSIDFFTPSVLAKPLKLFYPWN